MSVDCQPAGDVTGCKYVPASRLGLERLFGQRGESVAATSIFVRDKATLFGLEFE
ncbi:MAG TPA: hypothetical protein VIY90_09190 [Steroidobacteraceae bacterium]